MSYPTVRLGLPSSPILTAMAQAFFSLYCLVKNTPPPKVFFKFFKDLDLFFIYPKTAPNSQWQCVYILKVFQFHCT